MALPRSDQRAVLLYAAMLLSGAAGLGYEVVWSRLLSVSLGHETSAVLAVLSAFFVGMAIGAFAFNDRIRRSARASLWYVAAELMISAWAIALIFLIPWYNGFVSSFIGATPAPIWHWFSAFLATLVLLAPATVSLGMTLPAMVRIFETRIASPDRVSGLYAVNTLGAVIGTLFTTFYLAPTWGYPIALIACALANLLCAVMVATSIGWQPAGSHRSDSRRLSYQLGLLLFFTGCLGIGFEVAVIRALSQVFEDTVYTFAVILAVYLTGTAAGAAIYQTWRAEFSVWSTGTFLNLTGIATIIAVTLLWMALDTYYLALDWFPKSQLGAIAAETLVTAIVFVIPTVAMGLLFSHLITSANERGAMGRGLSLNTLGAASAPTLVGIVLVPAIGLKWSLVILICGYAALAVFYAPRSQGLAPALATILVVVGWLLPPLRFVEVPPGSQILAYRDGTNASVAVVETPDGVRHMKVNNHFAMGSTSSRHADHRQTHLPLLLHPDPRTLLVLGVGTGMSLSAAQYHPDLEVTAVELLREAPEFMHFFGTDPDLEGWARPPRLITADARRFVNADTAQYDVIIADLFHPARDGASALYTREHFEAVAARIRPDGLFCQWLPLFQMDLETFAEISGAFAEAFPHVQIHLPHFSLQQPIVGLIGTMLPIELDPDYLISRVTHRRLQRELVRLNLNSDLALLGGYLGDEITLNGFVGNRPSNRDLHPGVLFNAPRFAYLGLSEHGARLVELTDRLNLSAATPLREDRSDLSRRLRRYWEARDAYLSAGMNVRPHADPLRMLREVGEPLMEVVSISQDFSPAYLPLVQMAGQIHSQHPQIAGLLLESLIERAPNRPEARLLKNELARR